MHTYPLEINNTSVNEKDKFSIDKKPHTNQVSEVKAFMWKNSKKLMKGHLQAVEVGIAEPKQNLLSRRQQRNMIVEFEH